MDAHANFAYSTVATAPSPATSGTSLVVASGDGTKFPATPFNAVVWPAGSRPSTTNAEIVRVTGIASDTLTITRTQEGTSARSIVAGDQITAAVTKKTLTDIELGGTQLVYRYTVTGSDKASIDTGVDTPDAGSNDWTDGDLLEVHFYSRIDESVEAGQINVTVNNDTSSIYDVTRLLGNNNAASSAISFARANWFFVTLGASAAAGAFGSFEIIIPNYAGTVGNKCGKASHSVPSQAGVSFDEIALWEVAYRSTSALTRLKVIPNTAAKKFKVGSQLLIYKRKAS